MKHLVFVLITTNLILSCKPAETNQILFSSSRNGNSDIFLMEGKDRLVKQLTFKAVEEWSPTWINKEEISFMRQDGDEISRVKLNLLTMEESPLPQPKNCLLDDKNILYAQLSSKQLYVCNGDVFLADEEAGTLQNLSSKLEGISNYPSWARDEQSVLFTNNSTGDNEIYKFDLGSQALTNLTNNPANDERADLSPDGNYLLFSTSRFETGNQEIARLDLRTKEITNISKSPGMELIARWAEDGQSIYFGSNKDDNWEIYVYSPTTDSTERLTFNQAFDGDPRIR